MLRNAQNNNKPKRMPRDLEKAIKKGDEALATQLLSDPKYQNAAWINSKTSGGKTPLLLALHHKRYNIARLIMRNPHTDMNASYKDGYCTPNAYALCDNPDLSLELLLDARTDCPASDYPSSILLYSKRNDTAFQLRAIQALIAKGIDINTTYGGNATFLWWASFRGYTEVVRYLLSCPGIDVNKTCPLKRAADYQHAGILQQLLAHPDIDVSRKDFIEITATSSWKQDTSIRDKCIKALLNHPEIARKHLTNPILKWLLETNLDLYRQVINLPDTIISVITTKGDWYEHTTLKRLDVNPNLHSLLNTLTASPEFNVNMPLWNGHTLLTWVAEISNLSHLQILLDCKRLNLHQQNAYGHSALTLAARPGKQDMVEAIMSHPRFNLHATYAGSRNLLMHAAEHDCINLMQRLLAGEQFPINATDTEGNTALILLANRHKNANDASMFLELMRHGANPEQRNTSGINAIMAAKNNYLKGIAHVLKHEKPAKPDCDALPTAPVLDEAFMQAIETPPQPSQHGMFARNQEQHSNLPNEQLNACKYRGPQ